MRGKMRLALLATAGVLAFAADSATASPRIAERQITLRVHDTAVRGETKPVPTRFTVGTSIAFFVDGRLTAPIAGLGPSDCQRDYPTHGMVIRVNVCKDPSPPVRITVANASGCPHRVTIRLRFREPNASDKIAG